MTFSKEREREPDLNPNFLRNFCLLEMRPEKKFLDHVQRYKEGKEVKAAQQKSKEELFFFCLGSFLSYTNTNEKN